MLNPANTGPFAGTLTVRTAPTGQGVVLWDGHGQGQVVAFVFTGAITAQGHGPFAGMLLQRTVEEIPCASEAPGECLQRTGWILDPQGPEARACARTVPMRQGAVWVAG